MNSLEAEKAFWANPKKRAHFSRAYWEKELKRNNLDRAFFKNKSVCEIGCGPFGVIYFLDAKERIGVDPLLWYYEKMGLLSPERAKEMTLINGEGEDLKDVGNNSVDIVICFNVLDHTREPEKVLLEAKRILKPHGIFCLNVHVISKWLLPVRKALRYFDHPHPHHFCQKEVRSLMEQKGFAVKMESLYRISPEPTSLKAVIGRLAMFHYSIMAEKKQD